MRSLAFLALFLFWPLVAHADDRPAAASVSCADAAMPIDKLVCADPGLAAMDARLATAYRDALKAAGDSGGPGLQAGQRAWAVGRSAACLALATTGAKDAHADAVDCLERLYEQRVAVLQRASMEAAWPKLPFRPKLLSGAGDPVCAAVFADLEAGFLGGSLWIDPLGEREIGFASMPGLTEATGYRRADFDPYNSGKPVAVLQMLGEGGAERFGQGYYRRSTAAELTELAAQHAAAPDRAFGEFGELVTEQDVTLEAETANLPLPKFLTEYEVINPAMPRFFRVADKVYLFSLGTYYDEDGGIYSLANPHEATELCRFQSEPREDAEFKRYQQVTGPAKLPAVEALAAPLLPHGQVCETTGDEPYTRARRALYRPWAIDYWPAVPEKNGAADFNRYMRHRGLTGIEAHRAWRQFDAARGAAIAAIAPYYIDNFDRRDADAKALAAQWLDQRLYDDGSFYPDEPTSPLFAANFADAHRAAAAAFAGDGAALATALGADAKATAERQQGPFDEPLLTDALDHPELVKMLLDRGLDPDRFGASGRTALMTAARLDLVAAATMLLAHGANPNLGAGAAVETPYSEGDALCAKAGGAPPGDTPGRTALSYAAERGSPAMVKLLLAHGADRSRADKEGGLPETWAQKRVDAAADAVRALLRSPP
jgi:uncharacterized protein YecT (DUF1311 family)